MRLLVICMKLLTRCLALLGAEGKVTCLQVSSATSTATVNQTEPNVTDNIGYTRKKNAFDPKTFEPVQAAPNVSARVRLVPFSLQMGSEVSTQQSDKAQQPTWTAAVGRIDARVSLV